MDAARTFIPLLVFMLSPILIPIIGVVVGAMSDSIGRKSSTERPVGSRFDEVVERGRGRSVKDGLAFALEESLAPANSHAGEDTSSPLTRREREVASLVAQGMSNKEIAAQLVISQRTAEGHVEHILTKLGFTSRTQIVAMLRARDRFVAE